MPRIELDPGEAVDAAWVYLTAEEAADLGEALNAWASDDLQDPDWHCHLGDAVRGELTIAIGEPPERTQGAR